MSFLKTDAGFRWAIIVPTVGIVLFVIGHAILTIGMLSMQDVSTFAIHDGTYVGFENWAEVLSDPIAIDAAWNSVVWISGSVIATTVLGVITGIFLGRDNAIVRLVRAFLLIPWVLPGVVAAATWKWMLQSQTGVVNSILIQTGAIEQIIPWLGDPQMAMSVVIAAITWRLFPLFALVVAAACRTVDPSLYEAADIDGATPWQRIRFVLLPSIMPQIVTMSLLCTIWTANNIVFIQIMTGGGPFGATEILPTLLFRLAFDANQLGLSAAITVVNAVLLLAIAIVYIRVVRRIERKG